ncbi:hypothetical protein HAX54_046039 [Datura stramonium]|uniref:Uncharacterized protein n=1 Tax=Datura stramonium TaxID=4076 RepID=A0ABS8SSC6_DATST|nr:hypothetical protein [Datura stramonium]
MMMSIFSSFDALSAEVFGQKLSLSKAPTTHETNQQPGAAPLVTNRQAVASPPSTSSTGSLKKAGEASPPSSSRQQQQKRQSSFDALAAEIFGQKVSRSWEPASSDKKQQEQGVGPLVPDRKTVSSPPSTGGLKKSGEVAAPSSSRPQQQRRPSSFDALFAEMFGQKVSRSWVPKQQEQGVGPLVSDRKIATSPPSTGGLKKAAEAAASSSK